MCVNTVAKVVFLFFFHTICAQATFYVSTNGTDTNTCGSADPCATIGYAVSLTNDGDQVLITTGTYENQPSFVIEKNNILINGSGSPIFFLTIVTYLY